MQNLQQVRAVFPNAIFTCGKIIFASPKKHDTELEQLTDKLAVRMYVYIEKPLSEIGGLDAWKVEELNGHQCIVAYLEKGSDAGLIAKTVDMMERKISDILTEHAISFAWL